MKLDTMISALSILATFCVVVGSASAADKPGAGGERFFEMRKYYAAEGKLDELNARFRNHTNTLFAKHQITIIGFWVPVEGPEANKVLVYLLAYPSKEAREKSWQEFQTDPEWIKAKGDSEKNGKLVDKVESTYMKPTDYSPIK